MLIDSKLQHRINAKIQECLDLAAKRFNQNFKFPTVRYDLRGTKAGVARYGDWSVQFNSELLIRNVDDFIATTVPHEVAHLIDFEVYYNQTPTYGRKRHSAHGRTWKSIMYLFGAPANRCHSYDTSETQRKVKRKYHYKCEHCGADIPVGPVRHKNMSVKGIMYFHGSCGRKGRLILVKNLGQVTYKQARETFTQSADEPNSDCDQITIVYSTLKQIYADALLKQRFIEHCVSSLGMTKLAAEKQFKICSGESKNDL